MDNRVTSRFSRIFSPIMRDLSSLENSREKIQRRVNRVISYCRRSVGLTHGKRFAASRKELRKARDELLKIASLSDRSPRLLAWNLVTSAHQEFVEANLLFCISKGIEIPSARSLAVSSAAYLLGVADLVGELRRMVVNAIRSDDVSKAEESFRYMSLIFEHISRSRFSDSVVPGLRRKIDRARYMLEETNAELAQEYGRRRLIHQLEDMRRSMAST